MDERTSGSLKTRLSVTSNTPLHQLRFVRYRNDKSHLKGPKLSCKEFFKLYKLDNCCSTKNAYSAIMVILVTNDYDFDGL